jgi:hypothetical protein
MRRNWKKTDAAPKKKRKKSGSASPKKKKSTEKKVEDFEALVEKKKKDFEKQQEKNLKLLKKQIREEGEVLKNLDEEAGRHVIRKRKMVETKIKDLQQKLSQIEDGTTAAEFEKKLNDFCREKRRIIERAPALCKKVRKRPKAERKKLSDTNRRKTAGHNRNIKVSNSEKQENNGLEVLIQEFEDEFGDTTSSEDRAVFVALNNVCPRCNVNMQKLSAESVLSCPTCGIMAPYLDSTAASTSHSDERSFSNFAYSRSGHFSNWLRTIQGKESATIPPEILQGVCVELAKKRVAVEEVTAPRIRDALKQMKQRKYYENSVLICSLLTGRAPPRFSPEVERTLENLFLQIQDPFDRAKECLCPERKNFLSYPYVCLKLLQLLDSNSVDKQWLNPNRLPRLKGRDKLAKSDKIWRHICLQLNWKFIPSA